MELTYTRSTQETVSRTRIVYDLDYERAGNTGNWACGSVINAVPIFFHANESKGLDGAMATLVENIKLSIDRFDQAVLRLESNFTDKKLPPQEQKYLDTCRTTVTGLLQWSRSTDRYDLPRYMDKGGRCIITL
ncbi:terpene synthase family metal binding domain-containing protein [Penicillium macrosclerotiorum]|uniref:terpene synthase family metal binding domain-containing protein n=1 Tax=Penicillium macrosclerotiorum TaxID=303699 RepID=UPI002549879E|nr:terpene synthase family metal binding domain-containing protein [Penicillium macrosclerotiorum]KAJ5682867.1 terpene synthase family metal binding domain-containing protein [Penicillium macrosclerotiorum]